MANEDVAYVRVRIT